ERRHAEERSGHRVVNHSMGLGFDQLGHFVGGPPGGLYKQRHERLLTRIPMGEKWNQKAGVVLRSLKLSSGPMPAKTTSSDRAFPGRFWQRYPWVERAGRCGYYCFGNNRSPCAPDDWC